MRMANYTEHYQLHQWEPEDSFLRTDFNEDLGKIDAALQDVTTLAAGRADVITGTYTGNGAASRSIELGFTPKAVLLLLSTGHMSNAYIGYRYGGLAFEGAPVTTDWESKGGTPVLNIVSGGFQVYYDYDEDVFTNRDRYVYRYLALR